MCPVAGLKEFNGCPDTDGDGIQDSADACPDVFGFTLNGCPDTDGDGCWCEWCLSRRIWFSFIERVVQTLKDGVADKDDKCPTVAGPKKMQVVLFLILMETEF
jgi:hypothetical protein